MTSPKDRRPLIPGLTRKEIAERLGVSWRTVERWEQQGKWPNWVNKMLRLERIKPDKLLQKIKPDTSLKKVQPHKGPAERIKPSR